MLRQQSSKLPAIMIMGKFPSVGAVPSRRSLGAGRALFCEKQNFLYVKGMHKIQEHYKIQRRKLRDMKSDQENKNCY